MIFELLHSPYPDGYGEALLPLALCKEHLKADGDDEDDLIEALRDASIEFVERYCSVLFRETPGQVWRAEGFPKLHIYPLVMGVSPVQAITAVKWVGTDGSEVIAASPRMSAGPRGRSIASLSGPAHRPPPRPRPTRSAIPASASLARPGTS